MARAPSRGVGGHDDQELELLIATADRSGRPHQTLKHDDTFALLDNHGDIGVLGNKTNGLFFKDTRYLSHLELLIARDAPLLLGSTRDRTNLQLCSDLTNADVYADGALWLHKDVVHIYRTSYVRDGAICQRLMFTNHGSRDLDLPMTIVFDCDFADIFEVRGMRRPKRGTLERTPRTCQTVAFTYKGLDDVVRRTTVSVDPEPLSLKETAAHYLLRLSAKKSAAIFVTAEVCEGENPRITCTYAKGLRDAHRALRHSELRSTGITVSNRDLDLVLQRALADLRLLTTHTEDGPYPYAGTPWYSTTFGRDALITALQVLWLDPSIARGVLRRLARYQAQSFDADADAQPGKILHEMRGGEMAALGEIPFARYYGSVDSTPLFVIVADAYLAATGDAEFRAEIWPAVQRALEWLDGPGDPDGDGFIEYERGVLSGLANQGWKDSDDAIFHADGTLAQGPIALSEVQGYAYAARIAASRIAADLGRDRDAAQMVRQAEALREKFERDFWCDELGAYALALDGEKRQLRVRASNAGHVLSTGIASKQRAARIVQQMLAPCFFSGWGIRTVATGEARYNPMSYHNGSVWPHDNAMIAAGFARYGFRQSIEPIFDAMLDAALKMEDCRLPELFCGFRRRPGRAPVLYPLACSPQAWASGAMLHILGSMLGIDVDAASRTVRLRSPCLPARMGTVSIRNMRIGGGSADFTLRSRGGILVANVTNSRTGAKVILA